MSWTVRAAMRRGILLEVVAMNEEETKTWTYAFDMDGVQTPSEFKLSVRTQVRAQLNLLNSVEKPVDVTPEYIDL